MENQDIVWKQSFQHFSGAHEGLKEDFDVFQQRALTRLENQRVIQAFEITQELSWKVMKEFGEYQGFDEIIGSKNAILSAFNNKLIDDVEVWMQMIKSRNVKSFSNNQDEMIKTVATIFADYIQEFEKFKNKMLTM
jgi:nucleotidyltransferase substrate binding protein (TIGR01987 family)